MLVDVFYYQHYKTNILIMKPLRLFSIISLDYIPRGKTVGSKGIAFLKLSIPATKFNLGKCY